MLVDVLTVNWFICLLKKDTTPLNPVASAYCLPLTAF